MATNEVSQHTEFWNLTVLTAPKCTRKMGAEQVFALKEEICLVVKCDSNPPPTVKWFKDGKEINIKDPRVKIVVDGNTYKLSIANATRDDQGVYSAEFVNEHGQ